MFRRHISHQDIQDSQDLNLTPFLDVMITLIPFLMLCASFTTVVVVKAALPTPVESPDKAKIPPPFDLVAQADADSIRVFVNPKGGSDLPVVAIRTTRGETGYDSATLAAYHKALLKVKAAHPNETRVALDASPAVSLERLSQLMDQSSALQAGEAVAGVSNNGLFPQVALKGVYAP
jgi:biopolymer transport protein ExbD